MSNIFRYLKFLWRSTNAHGVHSPFVYDLVTKCFYNKAKPSLGKNSYGKHINKTALRTLNYLPDYLKTKAATLIVEDNHFINDLPNFQTLDRKADGNKDLIYIATENFNTNLVQQQLQNLKSTGVLIIERPYDNSQLWEQTKGLSEARVVVDTYFLGLIFPKISQAREEFKIRL